MRIFKERVTAPALGEVAVSEKRFAITYEVHCVLTVSQLWPDGDAPGNPTAIDVEGLIADEGGYLAILSEWNLHDEEGIGWVVEVKERSPRPDLPKATAR